MFRHTRFGRHAVVSVMIGALLLLPGVVFADPDEHHPDFVMHALWGLLYHQKDLNLSEDQVSKIKSLKLTYAKTHIKDEAEVKLAKVEALALKMDDKSEMGAIEAALQKLERVKAMRSAMAVLTPEQRQQWKLQLMKLAKKLHEKERCCDED
jgi:Spy/CpxP family protein refolding chaperone